MTINISKIFVIVNAWNERTFQLFAESSCLSHVQSRNEVLAFAEFIL